MIGVASYALPILVICLALPVAIFCHELGHAIPVLATGGRAHVMVGDTEGRTVDVGRIRVTVGSRSRWSLFYFGQCRWEGDRSRVVRAIGLLSGPGVTLLVVVATGVATTVIEDGPIRFAVVGLLYNQVWLALVTLAPVEYPPWFGMYAGSRSDGSKFLDLLRA